MSDESMVEKTARELASAFWELERLKDEKETMDENVSSMEQMVKERMERMAQAVEQG